MGGSCLLRLHSSTDSVEFKALQSGSTHNQKASQPVLHHYLVLCPAQP